MVNYWIGKGTGSRVRRLLVLNKALLRTWCRKVVLENLLEASDYMEVRKTRREMVF